MNITLQDGAVITFFGSTPFYGFTSDIPITEIIVDSNRFSAMNNLLCGHIGFRSAGTGVDRAASTALMLLGAASLILLGSIGGWHDMIGAGSSAPLDRCPAGDGHVGVARDERDEHTTWRP